MAKSNDTAHYDFTAWSTAHVGARPTGELLHTVHMLGLRPGKQALANAMALRDHGVTGSEIVIACGAPQLNRMRGLISDGLVKREPVAPRNGHTVYKLTLTPKGAKRVSTNEAKAAALVAAGEATEAPAKGKAKAKRKAKAKPATVQAPAATPATPEATVATGEASQPAPQQ